ncbi:MAG: hypothetical protein MUF40_04665 [Gemmatimonadaceae bacterium]|jgi:hypothetical protein|nr:hypothetical protein [Gemmatimonadaceae bacterium]
MTTFLAALISFIAAEFVIGWWALPLVGLVFGVLAARERQVGTRVGIAALLAWLALLAWTAQSGDVPAFYGALAGSMGLPTAAVAGLTIAFPLLLGGLAARFGAGLRHGTDRAAERGPGRR